MNRDVIYFNFIVILNYLICSYILSNNMSLSVIVVNKTNNDIINEKEPNILVDDNLSVIKEKLFAFNTGISFLPSLLKVEVKDKNNNFILLKDHNSLVFSLDSLPEKPSIYITNIFDVIEGTFDVLSLYKDKNSKEFDDIYEKLKNEYIDLSEDDFEFIIKVIFLKNNEYNEEVKIDVNEYITNALSNKEALLKKYTSLEKGLENFYNLARTTLDYDKLYDTIDDGIPMFSYTNISLLIRGKNFETGVRGKFIKLLQIFNQLELSEKIPFLAISTNESNDPMIKIYNKLIENIPEKEIKSWILNEKKKMNIMSYKKIKGLLIKYHIDDTTFITLNLLDNGIINAKLTLNENEYKINELLQFIKDGSDYVIDILNTLQGVFLQSKRLDSTINSDIFIDSITGSLTTNLLINRNKFNVALTNMYISNNIFELKDTISEDVLSLYYKKIGKREWDEKDTESDRKGITVNIRDNPYQLGSSIINIYGAFNLNQMIVIVKQLALISELDIEYDEEEDEITQKLKEKSHIKSLRKQGVTILSTKCQKPRQPIVDANTNPIGNSYILDYSGIKYVCPKKDYPYPGFTNENIVCCFKKDQRRRPAYIRNMKSSDFDILVQPSNFKITVQDPHSKNTYQTFAIKVISDYIDGFDETNSMSRYYYISNTNELVSITNNKLVDVLTNEEENGIWLDSMPLAKVITEPPKNKCNFPPDMNKKSEDDINAPCQHHSKNKIFGYNLNSYPCCFDKEREPVINRKKKISDITKQHILISDKILDYQRIGYLPPNLDNIFNKLLTGDNMYYRMGIVQNNAAFLNAILLACENTINNKQLNNSNEFKKHIVNHLNENMEEYQKLNGGNINMKYGKLQNYIDYILETKGIIQWNDMIDIIQRLANINILIIDIPYKSSDSTNIIDYDNTTLVCNPFLKYNKERDYIILIKRGNTFEVVIDMKDDNVIKTKFKYSENDTIKNNLVNFLVDYYTMSCVREDVFPESFTFDEMYTLNELNNLLKDTPHQIIGQIINKFKKVNYILTKKGVLIPIKETGITNIGKTMTLQSLVDSNKLLNLAQYKTGINLLNKILDKNISIRGITLDSENKNITSILTNFGQHIPLLPTLHQNENDIVVLDYKYHIDIDDILFDDTVKTTNKQKEWSMHINELKNKIYQTKLDIASKVSQNDQIKSDIININTEVKVPRINKINNIVSIFKNILGTQFIDNELNNFILKTIANDVINDNIENLLLNNLVTSDVFNPDEIIKRDTESVLLSIDDILRWFKKVK